METIPALALIPEGRPSGDLEAAIETIASWSEPFSQRALLIGVSGCHAILFLGSDSERMSSRIGSLGTDEIRKCPWVCAKDHRARHAGTQAGRDKAYRIRWLKTVRRCVGPKSVLAATTMPAGCSWTGPSNSSPPAPYCPSLSRRT